MSLGKKKNFQNESKMWQKFDRISSNACSIITGVTYCTLESICHAPYRCRKSQNQPLTKTFSYTMNYKDAQHTKTNSLLQFLTMVDHHNYGDHCKTLQCMWRGAVTVTFVEGNCSCLQVNWQHIVCILHLTTWETQGRYCN